MQDVVRHMRQGGHQHAGVGPGLHPFGGEMTAERARAGHRPEQAVQMARDRMQAATLPAQRRHVADARARQAPIFGGASSCRSEGGWQAAILLTPLRRVH